MTGWTAILPVKPSALGKQRLSMAPADRQLLARAFSLDVLDVLTRSASVDTVVVVTAEPQLGDAARRRGATILVDRPLLRPDGLNRAIEAACQWARARRADAPVVVVPGDLAALDEAALDQALDALGSWQRSFVPDLAGTGTTLLAATRPADLRPRFGTLSATRHAEAGHCAVLELDRRCRLDVDTYDDLARARRLGVGQHTAEALAHVIAAGSRAGHRLAVSSAS